MNGGRCMMRYALEWTGGRFDSAGQEKYPLFPVEVPGNIQYDFAKFQGLIEGLQFSDQVKRLEETEDYYWEYRAVAAYDLRPGQRIFLVAEGVDYQFEIRLDGKAIHSQEGMYTPVELDLTERLHPGALLQFIIYPHPKRPGPWDGFRQAADHSCKPPVCYGWDWNPRLLISGLWQPVYLETREADYIRACEPFYTLNEERTAAEIRFETDCDAPVRYTLQDARGAIVYQGNEPAFRLEPVHLWWCAGEGEPYLYTWTAETASDCKSGRLGLRTLRLVQNQGTLGEPQDFPKSRYAAAITLELNGRRIFGKGSNWVNPELFFGRITRERYAELLRLAADAHMNLLRVWGGAGVNKPDFYALCDEMGLLVWQEFMLACNHYPGTPEYLGVLEQEASSIIRALRGHPCLALWCGGNELFNGWSGMDEQDPPLRLLNKLCYELDFSRPFLMTSPSAGMAHGGYLFQDESTGLDVLASFPQKHFTAYTEFGVPALAAPEALRQIIPQEELFPVRPTAAWVTHHAFEAWGENSWACLPLLEAYFGPADSLDTLVAESQWLQAAGYQAIFEEARRQWPYCSMAVNWCFNEPWITAANNALTTYPAKPKPGYYAVRDALRPVLASARIPHFNWRAGERFSAGIWLLNDGNAPAREQITVTLRLGAWEKTLLQWDSGSVEGKSNLEGPTVHCVLPDATDAEELELILTAGDAAHSSRYRLHYRPRHPRKDAGRLNV